MESEMQKMEINPFNIFKANDTDTDVNEALNNKNNNNEYSFLKNGIFNVDEIIEKCQEKNGIELLNFMCFVMREKKRNILELLFKELGKEYLIAMLEKTLNIENSGGLTKGKSMYQKKKDEKDEKKTNENNSITINNINEKKTTGGIFFTLIKKDPEAKDILSKASKKDWKESRQRKKVYKLMDKLNI